MSKNTEFVKFDKVDKSYDGKVLVVKDLNHNISEGEFITMLGPSGAGKTTICNLLNNKLKNLYLSISYTTRSKKINEVHGKHYYFISKVILIYIEFI